MTQTWRACYLEGKLGLMVLILIQSDISFYSFILLFSASFHFGRLQETISAWLGYSVLTFNWLLLAQLGGSESFMKWRNCENLFVFWLKFAKSENPWLSRDVTIALTEPSQVLQLSWFRSVTINFCRAPRGTKLNTTKVYLVLFKEIRGNIMESSLQSSRGLKTFQSRDFLNGIKGWEDLHLEFSCQTDWDIFLFLPSTSSLCSTERISFGTEIWKGYYYYHHHHNPGQSITWHT